LAGELAICTVGAVDFYRLSARMGAPGRTASGAAAETPVTLVIFDLLPPDGEDMTSRPLVERKALLDGLALADRAWVTNRWFPGDGEDLFAVCVELGHVGVVAKRLDSVYRPGVRARSWVTMCRRASSCHRRPPRMTIRA
jgi:bifunctional non-homologous end joining protein LigD